MSSPNRTKPSDAPHLSSAARRLLAHSRQNNTPVLSAMVVKRNHPRRKRIWSAILAGIVVGALLFGGWHFGNGYLPPVTIAMPDVFIPQVQSTPTTHPTDAEFAAILRAELESQRRDSNGRAIVTAPPQADPPEPDAPSLPIATPTPVADTKIRPFP
jgi:hypothetical protein